MSDSYDLVVIGSGSAASVAAGRCRRAGWRVAMIDERPFGGTCALRGCDPKKVLVGVADAVDATRRLRGRGIAAEASLDWGALQAFKRTFTDPYPDKKEQGLRDTGIDILHGHARFTGPASISVGDRSLTAKHVLVATGARPAPMPFAGAALLTTSDDFLELAQLPRRVVFVGGGFISFEFAHVAARAGAAATILHRGERPLEGFDPDLVGLLAEHTRALGIDLRTRTEVVAVERDTDALIVTGRRERIEERFVADLVVHGAGRIPALDGLDLEAAGVEYTPTGVAVNEYLQSVSNPAVFAAGDAAGRGPALTPVAGYQGNIVATNLLSGLSTTTTAGPVPSVVFTIPALASVGLNEDDARRDGYDIDVHTGEMSGWYSSRRLGERAAGYKTLVDRDTQRILGAHLLGPHAGELINLFALAIRAELTVAQVKSTLFAYPTGASDVQYML